MAASFIEGKEKGYIIKIDNEFFGIASTLDEATKILNSIAEVEEQRMTSLGLEVFRKNDLWKIQLHTYSKSMFGKTLQKELELTIAEATSLVIPSLYADKIAQYKAEREASQRFITKILGSPRMRPLAADFII